MSEIPLYHHSLRPPTLCTRAQGECEAHGARPVHLINTMRKWIRTSRLSIKNSLSEVRCERLTRLGSGAHLLKQPDTIVPRGGAAQGPSTGKQPFIPFLHIFDLF